MWEQLGAVAVILGSQTRVVSFDLHMGLSSYCDFITTGYFKPLEMGQGWSKLVELVSLNKVQLLLSHIHDYRPLSVIKQITLSSLLQGPSFGWRVGMGWQKGKKVSVLSTVQMELRCQHDSYQSEWYC